MLINGTRHAYGVTFERYGKKFLATASKEVILSAGTINTPQLLMLSGIGPKNHLKEFQVNNMSRLKFFWMNINTEDALTLLPPKRIQTNHGLINDIFF